MDTDTTCTNCGHGPATHIHDSAPDLEVFRFCTWSCTLDYAAKVVRAEEEALGLVEPTLYGLADTD